MNTTIFISDLHLSEHTPRLNELFQHCLHEWKDNIDALYILGDFFDVWIGDDDDSDFIRRIKTELKTFTTSTPVYFIHGNRDFLLGEKFAAESGIKLLTAPQQINLYNHNYIIMHGDELCTDDVAYQQFRAQSRNPLWQMAVLNKPIAERRLLAGQIRQMSETRKNNEGKSEISDVTESAIHNLMASHAQATLPTLIHGHTHRPAVHESKLNNQPFKRYVIQDWSENYGGYLAVDAEGVHIHELKL
ncbi:UDP-2,3-diacylglucosamine diphosphatase [Snodgrassella alvi]|jgi:UDP-2,3-diacylglucosamine hydrolase|uniref:UDP-2,3-diacylglucosamine diphosphatase n=1 Tax=Snodgrassella alvi TaxID=1196083 RepID=UPI000C1E897D|nr:UDP-2,3-diacylglucosamine diphosphatase [Snodgrassella alvi]PIT13953.1 UDP-2,3-diacylglucosamine diphosphatase [Snodgrassella alvi]PIT56582.1 UDP-2,3-diacylglucosamine diphosphatase [Snodgrassella alvi]